MYPSFRDEEDAGKKRKEHTRLHEKKSFTNVISSMGRLQLNKQASTLPETIMNKWKSE